MGKEIAAEKEEEEAKKEKLKELKELLSTSCTCGRMCRDQHTSAYVSIRQHTSAHVSIRDDYKANVPWSRHICLSHMPPAQVQGKQPSLRESALVKILKAS